MCRLSDSLLGIEAFKVTSGVDLPRRRITSLNGSPHTLIYGSARDLIETRRLVLEHSGFDVTVTLDLEEARALLLERAFDLFILCHSLSHSNCTTALSLAHSLRPAAAHSQHNTGPREIITTPSFHHGPHSCRSRAPHSSAGHRRQKHSPGHPASTRCGGGGAPERDPSGSLKLDRECCRCPVFRRHPTYPGEKKPGQGAFHHCR